MPLEPGTQIGVYEVLSLLGQGGMGGVYRARDGRLKRTVALKILPPSFADDPHRVARFQREAEMLASLNHPNIAGIHGLVEGNGATALALELVEGGSLADRIARGLTVEAAVTVARQIAGALAAAHASGIVHRDLKPANVIVRPDGTAKVLDCGIAKAVDPALDGASEAVPATTLTAVGVVLGTPAYMAPEQATGGTTDARTDIWAFGCVLFEMLSGRRAFEGATVTETLNAVLTQTPDWSKLPGTTPPALRVLLRRCLARDPSQRPPNMDAVAFVLDEEGALSTGSTAAVTPASRRTWIVGAAALAAGVALTAGLWWSRSRAAAPVDAAGVVRATLPASASVLGPDRNFAFTADGTRLVYVNEDGGQLLARSLDALDAVPILTTQAYLRGVYPSPDGRWIAFIENSYTLRKVPAAGGTPVTIVVADGPTRGVSWGSDDTLLYATASTETGIQRVTAAGGAVTVLTRPDRARDELDHTSPIELPGGRGALFMVTTTKARNVAVLDLQSLTWRTVIEGATSARYVDSGHLVYSAAGSLWATRFDLTRLETVGTPVEVVPRAAFGQYAQFDVSRDGALVYARGVRAYGTDTNVPTWVTRGGTETPLGLPAGNYIHPRISPDGKRLAVAEESGDIYLWDLTHPRSQKSRLTFTEGQEWFPVWTPDSRRLVFGWRRGWGVSNIYIQDLDKSTAERLSDSPDMQIPNAVAPDGTVLFFSFPKDIKALSTPGGRETTLVDSPVEERNLALSRDGQWIAYEGETVGRAGELNVFVRPFPDVNRRVWQITTAGGTFPAWAHSGRELFYLKPDGTMAAVAIDVADGNLTLGDPVDLFRGRYLLRDGTLGRQYDVAADGRFLMLKEQSDTSHGHFVLVQNWTKELTRRVP